MSASGVLMKTDGHVAKRRKKSGSSVRCASRLTVVWKSARDQLPAIVVLRSTTGKYCAVIGADKTRYRLEFEGHLVSAWLTRRLLFGGANPSLGITIQRNAVRPKALLSSAASSSRSKPAKVVERGFTELPFDVMVEIFQRLDSVTRVRVQRVSKQWRAVLRDTPALQNHVMIDISLLPRINLTLKQVLRKVSAGPFNTLIVTDEESIATKLWMSPDCVPMDDDRRECVDDRCIWEWIQRRFDKGVLLRRVHVVFDRVVIYFRPFRMWPRQRFMSPACLYGECEPENIDRVSMRQVLLRAIGFTGVTGITKEFPHYCSGQRETLIPQATLHFFADDRGLEEQMWSFIERYTSPLSAEEYADLSALLDQRQTDPLDVMLLQMIVAGPPWNVSLPRHTTSAEPISSKQLRLLSPTVQFELLTQLRYLEFVDHLCEDEYFLT